MLGPVRERPLGFGNVHGHLHRLVPLRIRVHVADDGRDHDLVRGFLQALFRRQPTVGFRIRTT